MFRNLKSRRLRWIGHVAHTKESRKVYADLLGRLEGKRLLWRRKCRWEDDIKMDFRELGCNAGD